MKFKFKKIDLKNMSKSTMCLIIGGLFFFVGMICILTKPQVQYDSNTQIVTKILSVDESKALMDSVIKNIINIYEKPDELFEVTPGTYVDPAQQEEAKEETTTKKGKDKKKKEEVVEETPVENNALIVKNYKEIISNLFTEKGIKQLENMKFNKVNYIVKDGENVYFLNDVVGTDNKFAKDIYVYGTPIIKEDSIRCNISFNRVTIDGNDDTNYELFIKELVIVKKDGNWLVDSFQYSNG